MASLQSCLRVMEFDTGRALPSAARVRAQWDNTSGGGIDEFRDAVRSPSMYAVDSLMASSAGSSQQRKSGASSRTTGRWAHWCRAHDRPMFVIVYSASSQQLQS